MVIRVYADCSQPPPQRDPMLPGLRLRQVHERLGLPYPDVETASYELVALRGSPNFIMHISRLADIENRNVVPGLHKFYTLAALYHLNRWSCFDGLKFRLRNA